MNALTIANYLFLAIQKGELSPDAEVAIVPSMPSDPPWISEGKTFVELNSNYKPNQTPAENE
jgi:hypothetical protein